MNNFDDIRNIVKDRFLEINHLLELCNGLSVDRIVIIKSSIILLLYNTVEGSFSAILEMLFDYINDNELHVSKLNKNLQHIIYRYHIAVIGKNIKLFEDTYKKPNLTGIEFKTIDNKLNLFSGNLDAKKIREVSALVGIGIPETFNKKDIGTKLLIVKNLRNKLAHGEYSFSNACRDFTLNEVNDICADVKDYLDIVIDRYDDYIKSGKILN
jgi:hypothetical protein